MRRKSLTLPFIVVLLLCDPTSGQSSINWISGSHSSDVSDILIIGSKYEYSKIVENRNGDITTNTALILSFTLNLTIHRLDELSLKVNQSIPHNSEITNIQYIEPLESFGVSENIVNIKKDHTTEWDSNNSIYYDYTSISYSLFDGELEQQNISHTFELVYFRDEDAFEFPIDIEVSLGIQSVDGYTETVLDVVEIFENEFNTQRTYIGGNPDSYVIIIFIVVFIFGARQLVKWSKSRIEVV